VGIFAPDDHDRFTPIKPGISGGIIGTDGNEKYGHLVTNTVSDAFYPVIGFANKSSFDRNTVRLAPLHAYVQTSILDVLNRNTVHTPVSKGTGEIFTGSFVFAEDCRNSDELGSYAFPAGIAELFERTVIIYEQ
jgi:hypothetical protein